MSLCNYYWLSNMKTKQRLFLRIDDNPLGFFVCPVALQTAQPWTNYWSGTCLPAARCFLQYNYFPDLWGKSISIITDGQKTTFDCVYCPFYVCEIEMRTFSRTFLFGKRYIKKFNINFKGPAYYLYISERLWYRSTKNGWNGLQFSNSWKLFRGLLVY